MSEETALYSPRAAGHVVSQLGESPFWHPREQVLYYVDIKGRSLRRYDPATGDERAWPLPSEPGCCVPTAGKDLLVARRDGVFLFDPRTGGSRLIALAPYPDAQEERFNDGKCDAAGRFWCGTVFEPKTAPRGALYCLERGELTWRAGGVMTSNGLDWSPDGTTLYWTDTPTHSIGAWGFDMATGALAERREFHRFPERNAAVPIEAYGGRPDGGAVDAEGNYWVAMYEGARVVQLSAAGVILREVPLPVRCPTMPCFGGDDLRTLYITTVSAGRSAQELQACPLSGRVLCMRVDTPGRPCHVYHA